MQMHSFAFDVSHTLAGGLVLISLMMLYQDRLYSLLNVFALHALVLSLSVAWQAFIQDAPHLYVTAVIALVFKAIVIPVALHRIVKQLGIHRDIKSAVGIGPTRAGRNGARRPLAGSHAAGDERRRPAGARGSRLCAVGGAARTSGDGDAPQRGQPGCRVHVPRKRTGAGGDRRRGQCRSWSRSASPSRS